MSEERARLHFTLGPVQGFVAESRRTRDLWGSSFMLSYLAAHALAATERAGGKILLPNVAEDRLLAWVRAPGQGKVPEIGTIPNRFVVEYAGESEAAARKVAAEGANAAEAALRNAWKQAAEAVWERFVEPVATPGQTRTIWNRQVDHFWDAVWIITVGEDLGDFSALDLRKNWRSKDWCPEAGDKCTVMTGWQELSGCVRSWPEGRKEQDRFWERMREGVGSSLDLLPDERLCAVALVKRLYPRVRERALGPDWKAQGEVVNWPSTRWVAAVPWLARTLSGHRKAADAFCAVVEAQGLKEGVQSERRSKAKRLEGLPEEVRHHKLRYLDSNLYDERSLSNPNVTPFDARTREAIDGARRKLVAEVGAAPSTYYALLLMDGDSMGALLRTFSAASRIDAPSAALGRFARGVPKIVEGCDGVTVYAGGDDVLAMLPVEEALGCALKLEASYRAAFKGALEALPKGVERPRATISASLVLADTQLPMRAVIREAHRLLDDVAKDENGRDSIAVALWKPSGVNAVWATTWGHLRGGEGGAHLLASLGSRFPSGPGRGEGAVLSGSLVYRLRDQLSQLTGVALDVPGSVGYAPERVEVEKLVMAMILQSQDIQRGDEQKSNRTVAQAAAVEIVRACQQVRSPKVGQEERAGGLTFDPLILARFLAAGGQEDA